MTEIHISPHAPKRRDETAKYVGEAVYKVVGHWLQKDHAEWLRSGVAMPEVRAELMISQDVYGPGIRVTATIEADEDGGDDE